MRPILTALENGDALRLAGGDGLHGPRAAIPHTLDRHVPGQGAALEQGVDGVHEFTDRPYHRAASRLARTASRRVRNGPACGWSRW
jgi:hypothetical protein